MLLSINIGDEASATLTEEDLAAAKALEQIQREGIFALRDHLVAHNGSFEEADKALAKQAREHPLGPQPSEAPKRKSRPATEHEKKMKDVRDAAMV